MRARVCLLSVFVRVRILATLLFTFVQAQQIRQILGVFRTVKGPSLRLHLRRLYCRHALDRLHVTALLCAFSVVY